MKQLLIISLLLFTISLHAAGQTGFSGTAVFKIKPEYRGELSKASGFTGISSIDARLQSLGSTRAEPLFRTSGKRSAAAEINLIYRVQSQFPAQAVVNLLANDPHVQYAEVMYPDEAFAVPNDPNYSTSLYFSALEAEAAWDIHKGEEGAGVILALVDTGCRWTHPDLAENIWNNLGEDADHDGQTMYYNGSAWVMDSGDLNGVDDDLNGFVDDLNGWDFMLSSAGDQANDPYEDNGHGTIVSGIMDARTNNSLGISSLAWNLTLMPLSCDYGTGYIFNGYEAIAYAAENGADVINCSWGSSAFSQAAQDVITYAQSLGAIIVAAAGNSNNQVPLYPAAYRGVISTAALDNGGVKYSSSSYGAYVDVGAPSISIGATYGAGYATVNGATSYANPICTALTGLVKSYYPALSNQDIINRVKGSCDDVDALNPGKENLLGEGKLNAYHALSDVAPVPDNEIRLGLIENRPVTDANGNLAVEPGELFSVNLFLRNWGTGPGNATFTLSTSNPAVTILDNTETGVLAADDYYLLQNAFRIQASPTAASQYVTFTLQTTADIPVVAGSSLSFSILIHNGGIFIWEGTNGVRDMSGAFIRTTLQGMGYTCVYGNSFPSSFYSFDAVFLSFGSLSSANVRLSSISMFNAIRSYLESGGRLYMEGADAIGYDLATYFPLIEGGRDGDDIMWPLLGIAKATDGATNTIDALDGVSYTPTAGISFSASTQTNVSSIDLFTPLRAQSREAFVESGYGTVAIVSLGDYGQRSFVSSYALRELTDGSFPNTRANLLDKIMEYFEAQDVTLPLELLSFTAVYTNQPLLSWSTASETQLMGYNVYRGETSLLAAATQANALLIPSTGGADGACYQFRDEALPESDSLFYWLESVSISGSDQFFGPIILVLPTPDDPHPPLPPLAETIALHAYPNPFGNEAGLELKLAQDTDLCLQVFNIRGQLITTLVDRAYAAGTHHLVWDGRDNRGMNCGDGVYLLILQSPQGVLKKKLVKL